MAPPTSSRARTHTLPDDRALFLFGPLVRRKSVGTLPSSRRTASASLSSAPPVPTPPPSITSGSQGAPRIPSLHITTDLGSNFALQSRAAASAGPWRGTFLDAGPDPDGDSDNDVAFYDAFDAPKTAFDSETGLTLSPPIPDQQTADKQPHQHPTYLPPPPPRTSNARDSFISILDDPFFQRYHPSSDWFSNDSPSVEPATPSLPSATTFLSLTAVPSQPFQSSQSVYSQNPQTLRSNGAGAAADRNSTADGKASSSRHDTAPRSSWPRSLEPLSLKSPTGLTGRGLLKSLASPSSSMETVNIAVIGADGVGKSAFVQRALRLAKPPTQSITAIHLNVENRPFVVALIELDLEHFDVNPNQRINWPTNISGHIVPHIDGALMLYDVMNKDSIRDLPPTISALNISGLPTILVATKCDNPEPTRQINADAMATVFPSILTDFKTSVNVPNNTRDCLQTIVLAAVYNRQGALSFFSFFSFFFPVLVLFYRFTGSPFLFVSCFLFCLFSPFSYSLFPFPVPVFFLSLFTHAVLPGVGLAPLLPSGKCCRSSKLSERKQTVKVQHSPTPPHLFCHLLNLQLPADADESFFVSPCRLLFVLPLGCCFTAILLLLSRTLNSYRAFIPSALLRTALLPFAVLSRYCLLSLPYVSAVGRLWPLPISLARDLNWFVPLVTVTVYFTIPASTPALLLLNDSGSDSGLHVAVCFTPYYLFFPSIFFLFQSLKHPVAKMTRDSVAFVYIGDCHIYERIVPFSIPVTSISLVPIFLLSFSLYYQSLIYSYSPAVFSLMHPQTYLPTKR